MLPTRMYEVYTIMLENNRGLHKTYIVVLICQIFKDSVEYDTWDMLEKIGDWFKGSRMGHSVKVSLWCVLFLNQR